MEEAINSVGYILVTLTVSIVIASFIGYILIPLILSKCGVKRAIRILVSKIVALILFIVVFSIAFRSFSI